MATAVRLIPVLTISGGKLVKTIQFQNPRTLGSPMAAVRLFNSRNVDEMVILFIDGKISSQDFGLFDQVAKECFMPLAVGGGIKTMDDVDKLFALGADKVVIRTHTELIPEIAKKYGAQAIIQCFDTWEDNFDSYETLGGEIMFNDRKHDGMMDGYHPRQSKVPTILAGGAGKPEDFLTAYQAGASALAASSIWAYTEWTPDAVKRYLHENGVAVRL